MSSILIVTNRAPWPLKDGGALAMHQMILGYRSQGWKVHLLCMNTERHAVAEESLRRAYSALDSITIVPFDNRLRKRRLIGNYLFSALPEHAGRFYSKAFEQAWLGLLGSAKPDFIQVESLYLTEYLPAIRQASSARTILRMHNVEHEIWSRAAAAARGVKRHYLQTLARRMARYEPAAWSQYDLLLPIARPDAEAVEKSGCTTPCYLVPYGIAATRGQPGAETTNPPRDFNQLYHIGAMDWLPNREGIAWFIREAWPLVRQRNPRAAFHIAGRALAPDFSSPLPDGIANHGAVPDAAAFVRDKPVLIVPLKAGGGIRVKILEGMAAGKLVVSTAVGIQGIDAAPGEHFLLAETAADFAGAITWAAAHPAEAARIAEEGRGLVKRHHDLETIMSGLSARVKALLNP